MLQKIPSRLTQSLALSLVLIALSSCALFPKEQEPDIAKIKAANEALMQSEIPHVIFDFKAQCDKDDNCLVKGETLDKAVRVMSSQNLVIDKLVKAQNDTVITLTQCQYGKAQRDATIAYKDAQSFRDKVLYLGQQVVTVGLCGVLLLH